MEWNIGVFFKKIESVKLACVQFYQIDMRRLKELWEWTDLHTAHSSIYCVRVCLQNNPETDR